MAKKQVSKKAKTTSDPAKPVEIYEHHGSTRLNNPQVGLVNMKTESVEQKKKYEYDPHLDPQLIWAGKSEKNAFEIPTLSLHVHEKIDARSIIDAVKKSPQQIWEQYNLFNRPINKLSFVKEIEFYKHNKDWTNRLIAGDSLLIMNSLLEKESLGSKVQTIYFDPPYGIKYESNFQPFVNKRDVKDGRDEDLNQEPEMIRAFRDTWELGIHSYLGYLKDRLLLSKELLTDSGSIFLQIGEENMHLVRNILDEVFGPSNFVSLIYFKTTGGFDTGQLSRVGDYLIWYAKDKRKLKYNQLFTEKNLEDALDENFRFYEDSTGTRFNISDDAEGTPTLPQDAKPFATGDLCGQGSPKESTPFRFQGKVYHPAKNSHWKASYPTGMNRLAISGRIQIVGNTPRYVRFFDDKRVNPINNVWMDTGHAGFASNKKYVVETNPKVVEKCILMTSDPGDLVLDITCGSGTTPYVAEKWGRRWIAADTSRISITLAKQRLLTSVFDYYKTTSETEGVSSGFLYKSVPYIKMSDIAGSIEVDTIFNKYKDKIEPIIASIKRNHKEIDSFLDIPEEVPKSWSTEDQELWKQVNSMKKVVRLEIRHEIDRTAGQIKLIDQPEIDGKKIRVSGPFTVEAVPAPVVKSINEKEVSEPINGIFDWTQELLKSGIRAKNKEFIQFSRLEIVSGTKWIHAVGETKEENPQKVVISFGPDFAPFEQRQVEQAIQEAEKIKPSPTIIVFAAFQFDPEASKDIDELKWGGVSIVKVQMNADLFTNDLKKKKSTNESFWLVGQPEIEVKRISEGEKAGFYQVIVKGFDYYNPVTSGVTFGGPEQISMWMLDPDYDGRSLMPRQIFFPMAGPKDGWSRLAKTLKNEIDEELIEAYRGVESIPFQPGDNNKIAVKIIDDRGIESLVLRELE